MIIQFEELPQVKEKHPHKRVIFAGGVFDLVHAGHIHALKEFKNYGDILVIGISSDLRARERKGHKRPIISEKERLILLDAIKYVDYVFVAPEPNPNLELPTMRILEKLKPDVFASADRRWLDSLEQFKSFGINFKLVREKKVNSTSRIIDRIVERYVKEERATPNNFPPIRDKHARTPRS